MAPKQYRDRIYIIKDILLTISEHTELNQTTLTTYCGINLKKHRSILDELVKNNLMEKIEQIDGKRTKIIYKSTHEGLEFCKTILDPYEQIFPRYSNNIERLSLFFIF